MEIGNTVRLITPVIQGAITDTRFNKDEKQLEHLVGWNDAGTAHERWFLQSQLEVVA